MIAVVVSLVAVVLLVLVVVALGMRSMNRRESSLPPERLKEMAEKEEKTKTRSTDEFAKHEPRMTNFSPDFSPIDAPKQKPVRTGQRGRRGVDEWGNPVNDDDDEEFWASIRSEAEEGGFGAGGTVAARKASSSSSRSADRPTERTSEREQRTAAQADRPAARPSGRSGERPAKRSRPARPQPATASADPDATTVQAPLPQRQPSSQRQSPSQRQSSTQRQPAAANLADLVEPQKRVPSQAELADQRTVTFAAPTADVMSILGPGAQPVPAPTPPEPPTRPAPVASSGVSSNQSATGGYGASSTAGGSYPATPAATGSGSFPAAGPTSSGSFPATPAAPIHGAPTSDPFPAYGDTPDPLGTGYGSGASRPAASTASGSWPVSPSPDILDDPAPSSGASYGGGTSWPAFEQPASRSSYPATYEVSSGYAVADDSDPLTGPSPAGGTPTVPGRAVSNYDVLSAPTPPPAQPASPFAMGAYETGDITTSPASASWPEPPSSETGRSSYSRGRRSGSHRRANPDQDLPHDYYR